jgi:transposase InsO family protein
MIEDIQQATGYGIRQICAALEVPRSSFYHAASPTATASQDRTIGDRIEVIFKRHQRRYGYRRIGQELSDEGVVCAPDRIRRLMRARDLRAIQPKTYVPKTSDGRADKPSPNLLLEQPLPAKPDQVWAGDITYIPTSSGWLYLAVVIDLCSRKIVGWSLGDHLRAELVIEALRQALGKRPTLPGFIFHSDRGSQYGSAAYRALLRQAGIRQSMSACANPYHNAWTESFMGTLKTEMLQGGSFISHADARIELFAFIESYYNTHRKHSSLGYKTPASFEAQINSNN